MLATEKCMKYFEKTIKEKATGEGSPVAKPKHKRYTYGFVYVINIIHTRN